MNTRNTRRFRLNGMTLALAVALPGMLASQMVCAETKADTRPGSAQKATKPQKEETILVTASPGSESATSTLKAPVSTGALGTASALDTPFSVSTVTEKEIQDKQITTARELVANDASVTVPSIAYSNDGPQLNIRGIGQGFPLTGYFNGVPVSSYTQENPLELLERVDILKGATGFMYGFGAPGGIINYVTKKPTKETLLNVTAGYKSQGVFTQHVDVGGRGGEDDRFGLRLNVANEMGKLPVRGGSIDRQSVGLGLDAYLTPEIKISQDVMYGRRDVKNPSAASFNVRTLAASNGHLPSPVDINKLKLQVDSGDINERFLFSQTGIEWAFAEKWTAKIDYVFQKQDIRFLSPLPILTNSSGDYNMRVYDSHDRNYNHVIQSALAGEVNTGAITHNLNIGVSNRTLKSGTSPEAYFGPISGSGNIYTPERFDYNKKEMSAPKYEKTDEQAVFFSDRIIFNDNWEFLAGVRHTKYKHRNKEGETDYNKTVNTPTLALIFKPESNTSIYTSYVEALEQGGTVGPQYKNANETLSPLKSKQYEVGVKTDQNRWSATAALFRIERGAAYANADNVWVQDGEERYQGFELGGKFIINKNFDLNASTLWLDPTYRNVAPTKKSIEGNTVSGAPRFQSAVEFGWMPDTIPDMRTSLRWRHTGSASADEQGNIRVPSHDLLDFYVNYDTDTLGTPVTARFGVTNVTNKKYWAAGQNAVFVGEPRTFMANVTVRF